MQLRSVMTNLQVLLLCMIYKRKTRYRKKSNMPKTPWSKMTLRKRIKRWVCITMTRIWSFNYQSLMVLLIRIKKRKSIKLKKKNQTRILQMFCNVTKRSTRISSCKPNTHRSSSPRRLSSKSHNSSVLQWRWSRRTK